MSNLQLYILASCLTFVIYLVGAKWLTKQIRINDIIRALGCSIISPLFLLLCALGCVMMPIIYISFWWEDNPPLKKKLNNFLNKRIL